VHTDYESGKPKHLTGMKKIQLGLRVSCLIPKLFKDAVSTTYVIKRRIRRQDAYLLCSEYPSPGE